MNKIGAVYIPREFTPLAPEILDMIDGPRDIDNAYAYQELVEFYQPNSLLVRDYQLLPITHGQNCLLLA